MHMHFCGAVVACPEAAEGDHKYKGMDSKSRVNKAIEESKCLDCYYCALPSREVILPS